MGYTPVLVYPFAPAPLSRTVLSQCLANVTCRRSVEKKVKNHQRGRWQRARDTTHYLRGMISPRSFFAWLIAQSKAVWPAVVSGCTAKNAGSCPLNLLHGMVMDSSAIIHCKKKFFPRIHSGGQSQSGSSKPCSGSLSVQCFTICFQEAALGMWLSSECRFGTSGTTSPFSDNSERKST